MNYPRTQILARYRTILRVLSRHGLGILSDQLGLFGAAPWRWFPGAGPEVPGGRGERIRRACEELGPAFVKLGQSLSTRSDLLPPDIIAGLEKLQDQAAPLPFDQIREVLEQELERLPERILSVEQQPLASASLGQVHRAVLADGREVVLKVQRPGVAEQVELDLYVLQRLVAVAARRSRLIREYDLPGVARELSELMRGELDFIREGQNCDRFRANFAGDPEVRFPQVYWDCTTRRVLCLERMDGLRITDREGMVRAGLAPGSIASRLAGAIFRMVLRDGFFHADPHPGNLFVGPDGAVIFVDMGMVGELTPAMKSNVVDYVVGVVGRDPDRVVEAILRMGLIGRPGTTQALRDEVVRLQHTYGEVPLQQVEFGPVLRDTMAVARRFRLVFPTGYTVLLKALTTLESVARQVDPEATLVGLAAPYARLIMQGQGAPEKLLGRLGQELLESGRLLVRLPRLASRVLGLLEQGDLRIGIDHSGLGPALQRLSGIANRLAISILLASLIIGTALVSSSSQHSFLQRYALADVGFLLIGAMGLWLIISILGSRGLS